MPILSRGFARNSFANSFDLRFRLAGLFHYRNRQPGPAIKVEFVRESVRTRGRMCNAEGVEPDLPGERFVAWALLYRA